jgi:hypothetical protein
MPRRKDGRFLSPKSAAGRRALGRRPAKKSRSKTRSRTASRSKSKGGRRLSVKEQKALARRLGVTVKQLNAWTKAGARRRLSDAIAKKEKRSRDARRRLRAAAGPKYDREFLAVLKEFSDSIPEQVWCPKRNCAELIRKVVQKHGVLGIVPKTPADLQVIFMNPSERQGLNARCWICLYRAYRKLYYKKNGVYPGPDVSDDMADQFIESKDFSDSVEKFHPFTDALSKDDEDYLNAAVAKLQNYCKSLRAMDENSTDYLTLRDEVNRFLDDLETQYEGITDNLMGGSSKSALGSNCELLATRLNKLRRRVATGKGQALKRSSAAPPLPPLPPVSSIPPLFPGSSAPVGPLDLPLPPLSDEETSFLSAEDSRDLMSFPESRDFPFPASEESSGPFSKEASATDLFDF